MPNFSGAARRTGTYGSWQFRDFTGKPFPATFDVSAASTSGERDAVNVALGQLSNARLMERRITDYSVQINAANPANTAFDEAYATVDVQMVLIFQNTASGIPRYVKVPAPDAQFFLPDGETVIAPDAGATAGSAAFLLANSIAAIETAMGAGWLFARAYRSGTGRRQRQPLLIVEPTGNPDDDPGL